MSKTNSTYGKSISIKHYLNTRLKPKPYFHEGKILNSYPLYVRVSAKRQSTMIRSYIQDYVPVELYEEFTKKFSSDLEIETLELRRRVENENPFETDDFILAQAFYSIDKKKLPLSLVIPHALIVEISNALSLDYKNKITANKDFLFSTGTIISDFKIRNRNFFYSDILVNTDLPEEQIMSAAHVLSGNASDMFEKLSLKAFIIFANSEFSEALKLWNKYPLEIWSIQDILSIIQDKTGHTLRVEDLSSGYFFELYKSVFQSNKEITTLRSSIEVLSETCIALAETGKEMFIC